MQNQFRGQTMIKMTFRLKIGLVLTKLCKSWSKWHSAWKSDNFWWSYERSKLLKKCQGVCMENWMINGLVSKNYQIF